MPQTLIHPPKTMLEVWESLPEGTLCQLINNKLIMSAAPRDIHQAILFGIAFKLQTFLKRRKLGELRISPYDVHFSKQNILQPDILFIKNENVHKIEDKGLVGAPDIVIEILSPSTFQLDHEEKKLVYERFGVEEYFIVDPNTTSVDSFFLKNGIYEQQQIVKGKINSKILSTKILF